MDNVSQPLVEKDMDLKTALDTIRDRVRWRHLVKTSSSFNSWRKRTERSSCYYHLSSCLTKGLLLVCIHLLLTHLYSGTEYRFVVNIMRAGKTAHIFISISV